MNIKIYFLDLAFNCKSYFSMFSAISPLSSFRGKFAAFKHEFVNLYKIVCGFGLSLVHLSSKGQNFSNFRCSFMCFFAFKAKLDYDSQ